MNIDNDSIMPKYYQIKEYLLKYFQEMNIKENEKIPSENVLLKKFKVSRNTVRQAIDVLEKKGLVYKIQGKGTFFKNNKTNRNYLIGVISPMTSKYIYLDIIKGIEEYSHEKKYNIILSNSNWDVEKERESLEIMLEKRIDGLIIEPTLSSFITKDSYIFKKLSSLKIPVLLIDCLIKNIKLPTLTLDDVDCGYMAAEALIKNNHKRIAYIYNNDTISGNLRLKGYLKAMKKHKLVIDNSLISGFSMKEQKEDKEYVYFSSTCTDKLLNLKNPPTAIFYFNDEGAFSGAQTIKKYGLRIPDDISVIGFDDSEYSRFSEVPLTTVAHPKKNMGIMAAKMIIEEIESPGKLKKDVYFIKTSIVERNSIMTI